MSFTQNFAWYFILVLTYRYDVVYGKCGSYLNCAGCVKSGISCVWCQLANSTQFCIDGGITGPTDGTFCKSFGWGQCLVSGSFLWGTKYSYAIVIGVGGFVLVFGVSLCSVCCFKKCKKRKAIGLGDIEMTENPKKNRISYGIPASIADVNRECEVCFDRVKDTLLAPCGHVCLCYDCASLVKTQKQICPLCRTPIQNIYRAYFI